MDIVMNMRLNRLMTKPNLRVLAVVRDHMSGLLYAVPYLRALREQFPQGKVTLLANPYATPILEGCPYIDEIVPFFQFRQAAGKFARVNSMLLKSYAWARLVGRVDLVVHFRQVGGETTFFCSLLGRPFQVAYPQGKFDEMLDLKLPPGDVRLGSRQRNAVILEALGMHRISTQMEMWLTQEEKNWAGSFLQSEGWQANEPLFALHPGCHWGCNEWLPERWSQLGDMLINRYGGQVVLTGASDELDLVGQIAQDMQHQPIIAAGKTSLRQFAAVLNMASLVVSVDTAPTQICQALNIPSVILMGAGNPAWNGPLPGEPMMMLQKWDPSQATTMHCNGRAGTCHGLMCRSQLTNITTENILSIADKFMQ